MKWTFWISLAVVLYTYAGYPLLIAALARLRPKPWTRAPWKSGSHTTFKADGTSQSHPGLPPISIVMAVNNGANMLPAKLKHLFKLDPTLVREVIVVSDGSTDSTPQILRKTTEPRLQSIILDHQVGKAEAVNQGVAAAHGDILLFVDIRPRIATGALDKMLSNFADPAVGCVAGELVLDTDGHDATAAAVSGLYWRYEQGIRNCEAAFDSPVGVYGGFYAVRRNLVTRAPKGIILDDMFQPLAVISQGYRSVLDRTAVVVDRWPAKAAGEFDRKVRTLAGNFQLIRMAPWILTPRNRVLFQLISHKLMRLVVPYLFVVLIATSAILGMHSRPFAAFAILQTLFWLMAAAALKVRIPVLHRIASPASALLVLNAAAIAALYKFLFTTGPLWKIWLPTLVPADSHLFTQKHSRP